MSDSLAGLIINVDVSKVKAAIAALDALAVKAGEVEKKVSGATSGSSSSSNAAASATARQTQQIIAYERRLEAATKKHVDFINTLNGSGVNGLSRSNAIAEAERAYNRLNSVIGESRTMTLEGSRALRQYDNDMRKLNQTTQSNVSLNRQRSSEQTKSIAENDRLLKASVASQIATERALQSAQTSVTGVTGRANRQLPVGAASGISAQATRDLQAYSQAVQQFGRNSVEGAAAHGTFTRAMQAASGRIAEQGGLLRTLNDNTRTLNSAFGGASNSLSGFGRVVFQTSAALASLAGTFALREITQSIMEYERFSNTLRTVSGSSGEFSRNMTFLNAEADRIGFSIGEVGNSFARFSLAMTGAGFSSDQVRGSFSQLAEASRNLGLSSADTTGIIRALEQSMSKGKFMAEEVRLQLGDRLPFAMQALTRAVTQVDGRVSDINKRFEEGTLDVARYGVEFIRQINLMSGGAEALTRTSNTIAAAFGRLGTEFLRTTTAFGEAGFNNAVIIFSNNLERLLEFARESGALNALASGLLAAAKSMDSLGIVLGVVVSLFASRAIAGFVTMVAQMNPIIRGVTLGLGALAAAYNLISSASGSSATAAQNFNASMANLNTISGRVSENIQNYQNIIIRGAPLTDSSATAVDRLVSANMRLGDSFEAATVKAAAHYAEVNRLAMEQARREQENANRNLQGFLAGNSEISRFTRESGARRPSRRTALGGGWNLPGSETGITTAQDENVNRYLTEYTNLRASFQTTADGIKAEFGTNIPASITRLLLSLAQLEDSQQLRSLREAATTASRQLDNLANQINTLPDGEVQIRIIRDGIEAQGFNTPRPNGGPSLTEMDTSLAESIRAAGSPRTRLAALRPALTEGPLAGQFSGINLQGRDAEVLARLSKDPRVRNLLGGSATAITESLAQGRTGAGPAGSLSEALRDINLQATKAGNDPGAATAYADAIRRVQDAATNAQGSVSALAAEEEARAAVTRRLTNEMNLAIRTMKVETEGNQRLSAAFMNGSEAGREAEITQRAWTEAAKFAIRKTDENGNAIGRYAEVIADLTPKIRDAITAERDLAVARQYATGANDIAILEREGQLITANVSARNAEIAVMRMRQQFEGASESKLAVLETQIRRTELLRSQNEQLTNSWTEVSRIGEQAFERIGSAITEAFAQGKIDGISFKNIMKSVFSEVAQAALKLAIINPILNAAFGGTRGTASGIFSALGYGGTGIAGLSGNVAAGAPGTLVVNGMNYTAAGQQGMQQVGLLSAGRATGLGSAFTGGSSATGYGFIDSTLNANVWGNTGTGVVLGAGEGTTSAANALTGATTYAPGTTGAGISGLNVGGAIGGAAGIAGGAYGIYSGIQKGGIGGGLQVAGGAVSAGLGAATLAGLYPMLGALGPYGWAAAAILSIAGALLPGEKPSGMGQTAYENVDTGAESSVGLGGKRFSKANLDNSKSAAGQIADMAREIGSALGGAQFGSHVAVGTTNSTLYLDVAGRKAEFSNNEEGSKQLAETAARYVIQQFRSEGRATGDYAKILNNSPDDVTKLTENLDWYEKVYKAFNSTAEGTTPIISAFQQSLDDLNAQFQVSIDRANSLSLSTDKINEARQKEIDKLKDQRDAQVLGFDTALQIRKMRTENDNLTADIWEFDLAATDQIKQNKALLESWGLSTEEVANKIAENESVIGAERLLIYQKYADAVDSTSSAVDTLANKVEDMNVAQNNARDKASGTISNLMEYARSLTFGEGSTLTSEGKFGLARQQFGKVASLAQAGDASSVSNLRTYADQLLTSGRDMYGSGAQYASLFDSVLSTLGVISNLSEDTLTASFLAQVTETSTQTLVGELQALRQEVVGLRTQVAQQQTTPARA